MLFIMRGTSCSGKDTLIEKHFEAHTVLSSDWYRKVLTNDITNQQQNGIVFDTIHKLVEARLKNRLPYTVLNATNLKMKSSSDVLDIAEKYGENVTVISIDPPEVEELIRRSKARSEAGGLYVPEDVLKRHYDTYYAAMPAFMERAMKSVDNEFTFIRIDQNGNVVEENLYEVKARIRVLELERQNANL